MNGTYRKFRLLRLLKQILIFSCEFHLNIVYIINISINYLVVP